MQTIIFYTRRNVGMYLLPFLVAKKYQVKVITDDPQVRWIANLFNCPLVELHTMGSFDLFICCHGNKIIPGSFLQPGKFINIHPCLFKYKGHNPIKRYIENGDTMASVESHYMTEIVDSGEIVHQEFFSTEPISTYAEFYNIALQYYFRCMENTLISHQLKQSLKGLQTFNDALRKNFQ